MDLVVVPGNQRWDLALGGPLTDRVLGHKRGCCGCCCTRPSAAPAVGRAPPTPAHKPLGGNFEEGGELCQGRRAATPGPVLHERPADGSPGHHEPCERPSATQLACES